MENPLSILPQADLLRIKANSILNAKTKSALGQFFTAQPICLYMASLFNTIKGNIKLLDPGCGPGSLTAAFVDEALRRNEVKSLSLCFSDIENSLEPYIKETIEICTKQAAKFKIPVDCELLIEDFLLNHSGDFGLFTKGNDYTHIIMNPPYKKISTDSEHRKALRIAGIETVNLYTGFVALGIKKLAPGGELVAIIPRSFCNGLYYKPFREFILEETALQHIHIFDSRTNAFQGDEVLQENIIIHLIKGGKQKSITISSSPCADFQIDKKSGSITATDETTRTVPIDAIVDPNDKEKFIHIAANDRDQSIIERLSCFKTSLADLKLQVSTGPVMDFRLRDHLRQDLTNDSVPLIYPVHLNHSVHWPMVTKRPNAIAVSDKSRGWLWEHTGSYVIVRRFSSKEEKRRVVATYYDSSLPGDLIGFDNKLNVFHANKTGFDSELALGLFIYLNSTLLDKYYRLFGGHTQVNATDLRTIHYPSIDSLMRMGRNAKDSDLTQEEIDQLLNEEVTRMSGNTINPLNGQKKLDEALEILIALGLPREQQNERSALTLLALIRLLPQGNWQTIERPMMGVTPIMSWARDLYGKEYAPNTRETFRRQTLHQFIDGGLCLYNPDDPNRPVNSPKACYQLAEEVYRVLTTYGTSKWTKELKKWLKIRKTLVQQYAMKREMSKIPLTLSDGTIFRLSPGDHSQLIHDIVMEFGPRFAKGSELIYLGDTGAKEDFFKKERFAELGVKLNRKGKLPDVVLYWPEKDWLLLIESVTSHGPVDGKRHKELATLFAHATPGLVYVTAFPDHKTMAKYLSVISWETEVWVADAPTHMIHFNGDRFLGPYKKE